MPPQKHDHVEIAELLVGKLKHDDLSEEERIEVLAIWDKIYDEEEPVAVPEPLLDKIKKKDWISSYVPLGESWINAHENLWEHYINQTGSTITLANFAKLVDTSERGQARIKTVDSDAGSMPPPKMSLQPRRPERFKARGIENLGQTCYLSVAIHLTRACEPLRDAFLHQPFLSQKPKTDERTLNLATAMRTILIEIEDMSLSGPLQSTIVEQRTQSVKDSWDLGAQQDAAEAWGALKEALHVSTNAAVGEVASYQYPVGESVATSAATSWARVFKYESDSCAERPFLGQCVWERSCNVCGKPKPLTFETFTSVLLPIPQNRRSNRAITIDDLLSTMYRSQNIEVQCDTCNRMEAFTETQFLTQMPEYLAFVFLRFESGPTGQKISQQISFNEDGLNMYGWVHPDMRSGTKNLYDCCAVVHHRGDTMKSGHYVIYVREDKVDEEGTRWVLYNDSQASVATWAQIIVSYPSA